MLASAAALEFRVEFCIKSEQETMTESEWFHTFPAQIHTLQVGSTWTIPVRVLLSARARIHVAS